MQLKREQHGEKTPPMFLLDPSHHLLSREIFVANKKSQTKFEKNGQLFPLHGRSGQLVATQMLVCFIRESPSNSLKKSGLGIIVICPDGCLEAMLHQLLFLAHLIGDRLIPVARSFELMRGI